MPTLTKDIILTTLNSSYFHTAFGLRYLFSNLGELKEKAKILEFTTQQNNRDIAEQILSHSPKIVGLSVYIWNAVQSFELVTLLKRIDPNVKIVLGGPEVTYEFEEQPIFQLADHLICGEGDIAFRELCSKILAGESPSKIVRPELPNVLEMKLPYSLYTEEDIKNRVVYVEASRGCPYKCEFCLSSLDKSVRAFPLEAFLNEMQSLMEKGARAFKFVDRTFNLNYKTSLAILEFFLKHTHLNIFVHFELVPDRLPEELKEMIKKFPAGSLQFEVGIQTWNEEVAEFVSRRQNYQLTEDNLVFLKNETGVHLHTDLIAGLPGEDLKSFGKGFDKLFSLAPHEIQVGILKRLRGTPIIRHDQKFEMVYQATPPYPILKNKNLTYTDLQNVQRFAKFWDLYGNSGNFKRSLELLKTLGKNRAAPSFFDDFWEFSHFLNSRHPERHSIALVRLVESLWLYLTEVRKLPPNEVREKLIADYCHDTSRDIPPFLRVEGVRVASPARAPKSSLPKRQSLHHPPHNQLSV